MHISTIQTLTELLKITKTSKLERVLSTMLATGAKDHVGGGVPSQTLFDFHLITASIAFTSFNIVMTPATLIVSETI